jgi:hypothetical protein
MAVMKIYALFAYGFLSGTGERRLMAMFAQFDVIVFMGRF